jgi:hypothetical protein
MKKIILIMLFSSGYCFGQDDSSEQELVKITMPYDSTSQKILFKGIIELDSTYNAERIFNICKEWISVNINSFNISNSERQATFGKAMSQGFFGTKPDDNPATVDQLYKIEKPLKFEDVSAKRLTAAANIKYTGLGRMGISVMYINFDVKLSIKDYKLKIEMTNYSYTHYFINNMKQTQIASMNDNGPCNSKNSLENLYFNCNSFIRSQNDMYGFVGKQASKLKSDLTSFLKTNRVSDEKW